MPDLNPVLYNDCYRLDECWNEEEIRLMFVTLQNCQKYEKTIRGEWARARDLCILAALRYLLLRPNEACGVKFNEINWETKIWWVNPELNKERKPRPLSIPDRFIRYYKYYMSFPKWLWKDSAYLFPSSKNPRLSAHAWSRIFREKVLIPSGLYEMPKNTLPRTRSYLFRGTGATNLLDDGVSPWDVAQILGHSDLRTIKNYYFQTKKFRQRQAEALNKLV